MTAPSPSAVLDAVKRSGVRYKLAAGWDSKANAAGGTWAPAYVILHHTANGGAQGNAPSLGYVTTGNPYAPIRACHFLVGRDGLVHVIMAHKAYHAGEGGPGSWGDGPHVGADAMNGYGYGIEIESKGTSLDPAGSHGTNGITDAQYDATAQLAAALLDLLGRSNGCAINHRTWAPGRKSDTLLDDSKWRELIKPHRGATAPGPTPPPGGPTEGDDGPMILVRTKDGMGPHYVISGGVASKLAPGYRVDELGGGSTITLAADDNGKSFLTPFGVK